MPTLRAGSPVKVAAGGPGMPRVGALPGEEEEEAGGKSGSA